MLEGKSKPRRSTTHMKIQGIKTLISVKNKEGKHTHTHTITITTTTTSTTTETTGINNHCSMMSLNISDLNSSIKIHRLTEWV